MDDDSTGGWLRLSALLAGALMVFGTVYYAALWRERPDGFSRDPYRERIILFRGKKGASTGGR